MTHRIKAVKGESKSVLTATLLHELLELFGQPCEVHARDSKYFDPSGVRSAVRKARWQIEYLGVRDVFEIADLAMERRVPPGRTASSKTELRKHCGIKGIINPPSELQAIWQALPQRYWIKEQKIWLKKVKRWLKKRFPGAVGLVTLHTDKNRIHIEYMLLKYGSDREILPCFKGFKHDGPGVSGNRATAAIKGRKFTAAKRKKMKVNSITDIDWAMAMRTRLLKYLRKMGPTLRRKCLSQTRVVYADLEKNMHDKSNRRRVKLTKLDKARLEYQQFLKAIGEEKNRSTSSFKPVRIMNRAGWKLPQDAVLDMDEVKRLFAKIEFEIRTGKRPTLKSILRDLLRERDQRKSVIEKSLQASPLQLANDEVGLNPSIAEDRAIARSPVEAAEQGSEVESKPHPPELYYDFKVMASCEFPSATTIPIDEVSQFQNWMKEVGFPRFDGNPNRTFEDMVVDLVRIYIGTKHLSATPPVIESYEPPEVE